MNYSHAQTDVHCLASSNTAILNNNSFSALAIAAKGDVVKAVWHVLSTDVAYTALKLQSSDDLSGAWADVSGVALSGTDLPQAADSRKSFVIGGCKVAAKFYRIVATVGNGSLGSVGFGELIFSNRENSSAVTTGGHSGFSGQANAPVANWK